MTDSPRQIIEDFKREKWKADPLPRCLDLATRSPELAEEIAQLALRECPAGGTFLDAVLSFVGDAAWMRIVASAVDLLAAGSSKAAEDTIAYAAMQSRSSLQPHLERLFALAPNDDSYYEDWIWRDTGLSGIGFLTDQFRARDPAARLKPLSALLETRTEAALRFAVEHWSQVEHPPGMSVDNYLNEVGFELTDSSDIRPLYREQPFHVSFPSSYLPDEATHQHPTWNLSEGQSVPFGGIAESLCGWCGERLHRLLTLAPSVLDAGWEDLGALQLVICMSCLGWERDRMFVRHDPEGAPFALAGDDPSQTEPEFPSAGLVPTSVDLVPTGERWKWQDWALSNGRENLHRVGGHPSWIQGADYPSCPGCSATMDFLMQLDSNLPEVGGREWLWGSGGILYVFLCAPCRTSGYLWQCT